MYEQLDSADPPRGLARPRRERAALRRRHGHADLGPAGGATTSARRGGIRGAGSRSHAHVRHAGAALPDADHQPRRLARGGLGPIGRVPRAARRRAADPHHQPAAAGHRCWRATARVLAESPAGAAGEEADARVSPLGNAATALLGTVGPVPADRRAELEAMGVPPQGPVGAQRPRARARRPPAGNAGGRAAGGRPRAGLGRAASGARAAHEHLPRAAADDRRRARRPVRRDRGDAPVGADPRGRGHRARRPAASRLDLQDGDPLGRAGGASGEPPHGLPLRHLRDPGRRQAEQRQRRGMRRHARNRLRRVLQLGVLTAGRQARRRAPGGECRTPRLQLPHGHPRGAREHAPERRRNPRRTRRRLDRHRPGQRARDPAADGHGRRHDRRRRAAPPAHLPRRGPATGALRERSPPRWRGPSGG